jgi:hypothetical protein
MSLYSASTPPCEWRAPLGTRSGVTPSRVVQAFALAGSIALCGCGSATQGSDLASRACAADRTLACKFFDGNTRTWSTAPPRLVSIAAACALGGSHGEIDALVDTGGEYWLDRVGFQATGNAVRAGQLGASDDAGGATYGCGQGGGAVLTKLLCGKEIGLGTLVLTFAFAGHWADGTAWSKECRAEVDVTP